MFATEGVPPDVPLAGVDDVPAALHRVVQPLVVNPGRKPERGQDARPRAFRHEDLEAESRHAGPQGPGAGRMARDPSLDALLLQLDQDLPHGVDTCTAGVNGVPSASWLA